MIQWATGQVGAVQLRGIIDAPDPVLHSASRAYGFDPNTDDIVALLESGKSVITTKAPASPRTPKHLWAKLDHVAIGDRLFHWSATRKTLEGIAVGALIMLGTLFGG